MAATHADIEAMIPVVWRIVRRDFNIIGLDPRDLVQAGLEGVCKAAARWSEDRGASFQTFASYRARGAIQDYLRAEQPGSRLNPQPRPLSLDLDDADGTDWGRQERILDHFTTEDPEPHDELYYRRLIREIDQLPAGIAAAFRLYAEADMTMREIGDLEGVTESRISQKITRARELLRPRLAELLSEAA